MIEQFSQKNSKGVEYYLNKKSVTLNNGAVSTVWYFSKDFRVATATSLPADRVVTESARSHILLLKKR